VDAVALGLVGSRRVAAFPFFFFGLFARFLDLGLDTISSDLATECVSTKAGQLHASLDLDCRDCADSRPAPARFPDRRADFASVREEDDSAALIREPESLLGRREVDEPRLVHGRCGPVVRPDLVAGDRTVRRDLREPHVVAGGRGAADPNGCSGHLTRVSTIHSSVGPESGSTT